MADNDICSLLGDFDEKYTLAFALTVHCLMRHFDDVHITPSCICCRAENGGVELQLDGFIAVEGRLHPEEVQGLAQAGEAWRQFVKRG
jgi:hypothetical protein